jgi:hypothetical protein
MGAEVKSPPGNGLYFFRIHGEIYHFVSLLYPNDKSIVSRCSITTEFLDAFQILTHCISSNYMSIF